MATPAEGLSERQNVQIAQNVQNANRGPSMTAHYEVRGDVAVIALDNPPVNGLGYATRVALAAGVNRAEDDPAVRAIVVTGAGKAFSGGADIKEFGSPKATSEPNLLSLIAQLEACSKPTVAAVHSVCMGGGLELALGCHWCPVPAARSACRAPSAWSRR